VKVKGVKGAGKGRPFVSDPFAQKSGQVWVRTLRSLRARKKPRNSPNLRNLCQEFWRIGEDEIKAAVVRRIRGIPIGHFPKQHRRSRIDHIHRLPAADRPGRFVCGVVLLQVDMVPHIKVKPNLTLASPIRVDSCCFVVSTVMNSAGQSRSTACMKAPKSYPAQPMPVLRFGTITHTTSVRAITVTATHMIRTTSR